MVKATMKATLCVALALFVCGTQGFITTIGAHGVECFREEAPKGENVKLLFQVSHNTHPPFVHNPANRACPTHHSLLLSQVLEGGDVDVDFEILDPVGGKVFEGRRQPEGKYDFRAAHAGQYKFCFSNHYSSTADKRISIDITVGDQL